MNTKRNAENDSVVKSAARTLDIFELLAEHPGGLSFIEISERTKIPISSLHNLLSTLITRGYLIRNRSSEFQLGPKIGQISGSYNANINLVLLADEQMEEITRITGETTSLAVLQGQMIVFIHKRPGEGILQVINPVGTRLCAHCTGSGKVMLAYLPLTDFNWLYPDEELHPLTQNSMRSKSVLRAELDEIAQEGFAYNLEESEDGVWAVAGCIRDQQGMPVASISIVAPTTRMKTKNHNGWEKLVAEASEKVSYQLGFRKDRFTKNIKVLSR